MRPMVTVNGVAGVAALGVRFWSVVGDFQRHSRKGEEFSAGLTPDTVEWMKRRWRWVEGRFKNGVAD